MVLSMLLSYLSSGLIRILLSKTLSILWSYLYYGLIYDMVLSILWPYPYVVFKTVSALIRDYN